MPTPVREPTADPRIAWGATTTATTAARGAREAATNVTTAARGTRGADNAATTAAGHRCSSLAHWYLLLRELARAPASLSDPAGTCCCC